MSAEGHSAQGGVMFLVMKMENSHVHPEHTIVSEHMYYMALPLHDLVAIQFHNPA